MKQLKNTRVALLLFLATLASGLSAQQISLSGNVKDKTGEPVIGASILEKNTSNGTITDFDGNFNLQVGANSTVVVSYIGMKSQEISLKGKTRIDVVLDDDAQALDEIVVIGYGTVKKRDLTGSVASVNNETLVTNPVSDVSQALQGRLPGVTVVSQDGRPGAEVAIRIRGGGSVTQSNDPLFVVDGFPVSSISDIPADQIESIDVLKDASSTAIYGARGANGVVLVTTKGAGKEKMSVSYSGYVQLKEAASSYSTLNAQEYLRYWWGYTNSIGGNYADGFAKYFGLGSTYGNRYGDYAGMQTHNYTDDILRTAFAHSHNLNVSGGSDKTKMVFNVNYVDDDGIKIESGISRMNLSLKVQQEIAKNLKLDVDFRFVETKQNGIEETPENGKGSILSSAYMYLPIDNPLGGVAFTDASYGFGNGDAYVDITKGTPKERIKNIRNLAKKQNFRATAALTWDVIDGLTARSELSIAKTNSITNYYRNNISENYKEGKVSKGDGNNLRSATTLNYQFKGLGDAHNLSLLVGNEILRSKSNSSIMYGKGYPDSFGYDEVIGLLSMYETDGYYKNTLGTPNTTVSFFGRANYSLLDRYLFTATFRADGSSKFAPNKRWGYFPAAAFAWRISDEPFMESASNWLDNLKLRLSIGTSGSDNIDPSLWKETWVASTETINGETTTVYKPEGLLPNRNLKWETTISQNLGIDFSVLNGRLYGTLDLYRNTTKDLLMRVPIDETTGYSYQFDNIGKTENRGLELSLGTDIIRNKDFTLSVNATYNYNRNKIKELKDGIKRDYGTQWASTTGSPGYDYIFSVGKSVGVIRAYVSDGYYKPEDFTYSGGVYTLNGVADMPTVDKGYGGYPHPFSIPTGQSAFPGAMKLRDADGDGVADIKEYEVTPKHTGGFSINATYKGVDFNAGFNWVIGGYVYNVNALVNMYANGTTSIGANRLSLINDTYRFYNVDASGELYAVTTPEELNSINSGAKYYSSHTGYGITTSNFIEKGTYLRLQNVTIGYSLPKKIIAKAGMQKLRVYFTGTNLFTLTGYSGLDPEINAIPNRSNSQGNPGGFPTPGLDFGTYPRARTYTLGLNVTF